MEKMRHSFRHMFADKLVKAQELLCSMSVIQTITYQAIIFRDRIRRLVSAKRMQFQV